MALYEQALAQWDKPDIRWNLALVLEDLGQYLRAYQRLDGALRWREALGAERLRDVQARIVALGSVPSPPLRASSGRVSLADQLATWCLDDVYLGVPRRRRGRGPRDRGRPPDRRRRGRQPDPPGPELDRAGRRSAGHEMTRRRSAPAAVLDTARHVR
jgi:hypothetical protein